MNNQIQLVYDFWFGDILTNPNAKDRNSFWYMGGKAVDQQIHEQFEPLVLLAQAMKLEDWKQSAEGSMALIILLDQFPLNMYRGEKRAYATEQHSVDVCLHGITNKQDKMLSFYERTFFYLPLEHSESAEHQELSIQHYTALYEEAEDRYKNPAQNALQYAIDHKAIIDQFGRYPHRNRVLGRESTKEEIKYLEEGGATYGQ